MHLFLLPGRADSRAKESQKDREKSERKKIKQTNKQTGRVLQTQVSFERNSELLWTSGFFFSRVWKCFCLCIITGNVFRILDLGFPGCVHMLGNMHNMKPHNPSSSTKLLLLTYQQNEGHRMINSMESDYHFGFWRHRWRTICELVCCISTVHVTLLQISTFSTLSVWFEW